MEIGRNFAEAKLGYRPDAMLIDDLINIGHDADGL